MGQATILLAEDTRDVRLLMVSVLRQKGYQVLDAPDGLSALEIAERYPGSIDLVITDVNMPRLDGPGLCHRLKQLRPGIKTLLVSGATTGRDADDATFLAKPFTAHHLLSSARRLLELPSTVEA